MGNEYGGKVEMELIRMKFSCWGEENDDGKIGQGQTMNVWKSDFLSPQTKVILYPKNKQKSL